MCFGWMYHDISVYARRHLFLFCVSARFSSQITKPKLMKVHRWNVRRRLTSCIIFYLELSTSMIPYRYSIPAGINPFKKVCMNVRIVLKKWMRCPVCFLFLLVISETGSSNERDVRAHRVMNVFFSSFPLEVLTQWHIEYYNVEFAEITLWNKPN